MRRFVEQCLNRPDLTFDELWWPDFWPDLKNDQSSFVMIFDGFSNAAYRHRVSLRGPGAELDGGLNNSPPHPSGGGKSRGPSGRDLNMYHMTLV